MTPILSSQAQNLWHPFGTKSGQVESFGKRSLKIGRSEKELEIKYLIGAEDESRTHTTLFRSQDFKSFSALFSKPRNRTYLPDNKRKSVTSALGDQRAKTARFETLCHPGGTKVCLCPDCLAGILNPPS